MRRILLCLLFSLVLCAVAGTLAWAASPLITGVNLDRGRDVSPDGTASYHERISVSVFDGDGAADITSITISDSEGYDHTVTPTGGGWWSQEGDFAVSCEWSEWDASTPPPPGLYTVTATDSDANSDSLMANAPAVREVTPVLLYPGPNNSMILEVVPTFTWEDALIGGCYRFVVSDRATNSNVWEYWPSGVTSVTYNEDDGATQLELTPGHTYDVQLIHQYPEDPFVSDSRVCVRTYAHQFGTFTVYSPDPVIQDVYVCHGRDTDAPDWGEYHRRAYVRATDGDGAADITSIIITDSDGVDHVKTPGCGCWWQDDDHTVSASVCGGGEHLVSAPGGAPYSIAVTDASSNTDSLVTAVVPVASDVHPVPVSPVMDSVIYDTAPTFEWNAGLPGSWYGLHLEEEGTLGDIWFVDVGEPADPVIQIPYDGELQPNHAYFWSIDAWRPEDVRVSDPRVEIWTSQWTRARFTVYGGWSEIPPDLPGKLAYSAVPWAEDVFWTWGMSRIVLYDTDPNLRTWLQSDWTWSVEWCADGTKLLFVKEPGVWVDYLDGTDPVQIPNLPSWGWARWAPDGDRVVFQFWGPENPDLPQNYDIWVTDIDGTNPYPLVESFDSRDQFPFWSPDGLWIAYTKSPDPEGMSLHLVRYDGTEDHAVVAAGVVGYPEYQVDYMADSSWSPDGKRLATAFSASLAGASGEAEGWISGIGIIPREGGLLAPVFLTPPGVICCALPRGPAWSPDGTQIVFASGHHLAPEELPGAEEFCPGVELWVVNADGLGDPIRLTYDHSFNVPTSWWAPNTEPGADVSVTKGDTTVSFDTVTDSGSTTAVTFDDPPGETPEGFQFLGDYYDISTTATLEPGSKITIEIHYDDADVPGGEEEWLSLLHWETDHWEDITVRPIDTVNNIITGECYSLSAFGVAHGPQLVYPLPPINADGSSVFKLNRTVPVKFQLIATDGSYVSDAVARLYVDMVSTEVTGTVAEPGTTTEADTGYVFRYDPTANQYIFNLGTKGLSVGTWTLTLVADELPPKQVQISLR